MTSVQTAARTITCWGELVWDVFQNASPTLNGSRVLGGCATAVAAQLAELGVSVRLVSAVGDDPEGVQALGELSRRGVDVSGVSRAVGSSTATVDISVLSSGEPEYLANRRLDWARVDFEPALSRAVSGVDALTFGLFAQGTCLELAALERALSHVRPRLVGCDLNVRRAVSPDLLARVAGSADFVKLNQKEYERVAEALAGQEPASWLLRAGRTRLVALTSGANGAQLVTPDAVVCQPASSALALVDTVGAGDAFMAALTLGLLEKLHLQAALGRAVARAEQQLLKRGAMP